jgi:hypothetical protein
MSIAQKSLIANGIRINIEAPLNEMIEHAVEGSVQRRRLYVHAGIVEKRSIIKEHECKQETLQQAVVEIQIASRNF